MEETSVKNGGVVEFSVSSTANVTNSIKGATVRKPEISDVDLSANIVNFGSKLSTDKIQIVKKVATDKAMRHINYNPDKRQDSVYTHEVGKR